MEDGMAKFNMDWHHSCFANVQNSLARERADVERRVNDLKKREADCKFYAEQIQEAVKRELDGFDRDRLLVKRASVKA